MDFDKQNTHSQLINSVDNVRDELRRTGWQQDYTWAADTAAEGIANLGEHIARLNDVSTQQGLALLTATIDQTRLLARLEAAMLNPTATAGAEFYRRGLYALQHVWYEEAIQDLQTAIEKYPYLPDAYCALGDAYAAISDHQKAADSYKRAIRYAVPDELAMAAQAALWAARELSLLGDADGAVEILRLTHAQIPHCAEVAYELALLTDDQTLLATAFSTAPELAGSALLLKQANEVARQVLTAGSSTRQAFAPLYAQSVKLLGEVHAQAVHLLRTYYLRSTTSDLKTQLDELTPPAFPAPEIKYPPLPSGVAPTAQLFLVAGMLPQLGKDMDASFYHLSHWHAVTKNHAKSEAERQAQKVSFNELSAQVRSVQASLQWPRVRALST